MEFVLLIFGLVTFNIAWRARGEARHLRRLIDELRDEVGALRNAATPAFKATPPPEAAAAPSAPQRSPPLAVPEQVPVLVPVPVPAPVPGPAPATGSTPLPMPALASIATPALRPAVPPADTGPAITVTAATPVTAPPVGAPPPPPPRRSAPPIGIGLRTAMAAHRQVLAVRRQPGGQARPVNPVHRRQLPA